MGKRKRKSHISKRKQKEDEYFAEMEPGQSDDRFMYMNVKRKSKMSKKMRKMARKEERHSSGKANFWGDFKETDGYHKVEIFVKDISNIEKSFLVNSIKDYVDSPFNPLGFFKEEDSVIFYFESNSEVAEAIKSLSRRIPSPTGELMGIKVSLQKEIDFILNCEQVELVKDVMIKRFDLTLGLLNLSNLHNDSQLLERDSFVPLSNERVFRKILLLINELIPNLSALDLSNNKLEDNSLKIIETLNLNFPFLTALSLQNNNLIGVKCLRFLRTLHLKEINLIGNKFYDIMKTPTHKYLKNVKKELPFLRIVDNVDVSKGVLDDPNFSATPGNFSKPVMLFTSPEAISEEKLKTFLEQYYAIFDSLDKETLLQAYVPTAKIEVRSEHSIVASRAVEGQAQIKEFLSSWPPTLHDHGSFALEILSSSPQEAVIQVMGACLLVEAQVTFHFKRTMKIIPFNSGFCCSEDLLEIQ